MEANLLEAERELAEETREVRVPVIAPKTRNGEYSRLRAVMMHVVALLGFLGLWYLITLVTPQYAFPTPGAVATIMWDITKSGDLWRQASATLQRTVLSLIGAMVIGTALGILMGVNGYWESFTRNWVYMALSLPGIVWAMLMVLWLGVNEKALFIAVVFIIFPYVAVNVFEGVKSIDRDLLDMGRSFRLKRGSMIRHVIMPSLTPYLVGAVRQNFANSWKMVTIAELFGASTGIGFMIRSGFEFFNVAMMVAWVAAFAIIILAIEYGIIGPFRKYMLRWRPEIDEVI